MPPGRTASPAVVVNGNCGGGSGGDGNSGTGGCAVAAGGTSGSEAVSGSGAKSSGAKSSGSSVVGTRLPDVADILTQVWQLLPGSLRRAGHAPPPLVAAGQQG
jgi:hypothetical protein